MFKHRTSLSWWSFIVNSILAKVSYLTLRHSVHVSYLILWSWYLVFISCFSLLCFVFCCLSFVLFTFFVMASSVYFLLMSFNVPFISFAIYILWHRSIYNVSHKGQPRRDCVCKICVLFMHRCQYNGIRCDCRTSERFSAINPGSIHHFLHKKTSVPSQEYDSCYLFVWCVRAIDFANW